MQDKKTMFHVLKQRYMVRAGIVIVAVVFVAAGAFSIFAGEDKNIENDMPTFVVKQGPLRINIIESGTIKARQQVIIKSQVEGRTTILSLVLEGTLIKKGDLLIELDASKLLDNKIDQEIKVQNAEAAFIRARENLAVVKNQAQSDKDKATLDLRFARLDLEKYIDPNEGEYSNQLMEARRNITLAKGELKRAENQLDWSEKLLK